jgi:hypothetical protein
MNQPVSRLGTSPEEGIKAPVVVATTANITLSGEQTINSVAVVAGDRVLVMNQTDATENGIYNVSTTTWSRATDFNAASDVVNGVLVLSANNGYVWQAFFTGDYVADTTEVTFTRNVFSDLQSEQFFYDNHASSAANAYSLQVPAAKTTPSEYLANLMMTFRPSHTSSSTGVTVRVLGASGQLATLPYVMEDGSTLPVSGFFTTDRDVTCRIASDLSKVIHVSKKIDVTATTFTNIGGSARDNTDLDTELDLITTEHHKFHTNHASSAADAYVLTPTVSPLPTAWVTGKIYEFSPSHANTGACTVDIYGLNGLIGAKNYKMEDGTDPVANFFVPTEHLRARYDGTKLIHMSGGSATVNEVRGANFDGVVPITTTPYTIVSTNYGYQHILSASAASVTMDAIADSDIGDTFNFKNDLGSTIAFNRDGSSTFAGVPSEYGSTTTFNLPGYANLRITKYDATTWEVQISLGSARQIMHVQDRKAAGTDGGTFTSGAWRTRTLNTQVTNTITDASLATNQITLPAGTYEVQASAPTHSVGLNKLKLVNITDTTDLLNGTSVTDGDSVGSLAVLSGVITLTAAKVIELQHRCSGGQPTTGFGQASGFSTTEVYSEVMIKKL